MFSFSGFNHHSSFDKQVGLVDSDPAKLSNDTGVQLLSELISSKRKKLGSCRYYWVALFVLKYIFSPQASVNSERLTVTYQTLINTYYHRQLI